VTLSVVLLVALGAAVGAPVRFLVERRLAGAYPWGTFAVNVAGSAVLGGLVAVAGTSSSAAAVALVGTGFCGALTTFGGFAAQVLDLATAAPSASGDVRTGGGRAGAALGYAAASVAACIAVAGIAYVTVASLSG